jgi:hypothetical protein
MSCADGRHGIDRRQFLVGAATVTAAAALGLGAAEAQAPKLRLGIIGCGGRGGWIGGLFEENSNTKVVALHDYFEDRVADLRKEYDTAKAANDEQKVKDLEQQAEWMQIRLHQQGFSTATVAAYVEKVADKLPAIAAEAKVTTIVSKWEVHYYKDSSVELVDVTMPMVRLFTTNPDLLKMIQQMLSQPPIPFDQLGLSAKD